MHQITPRRAAAVSLAILGILGMSTAGCADSVPRGESRESPAGATSPAPGAFTADPLSRYLPSAADQQIIEQGLRSGIITCLRSLGLQPLASVAVQPSPTLQSETSIATISGSLSVARAEHYGYVPATAGNGPLLALDVGWAVTYRIPRTHGAELSAVRAVLLGQVTQLHGRSVPDGGCLAATIRQVTGDLSSAADQPSGDPDALPLLLMEQAVSQMEADSRVKGVTSRWQACMRQTGYDYATPAAAQADPRWLRAAAVGATEESLIKLQVPVATADARCRARVGYASVRLTAFTAALGKIIAASETQRGLARFDADVAGAVSRARHLMATA